MSVNTAELPQVFARYRDRIDAALRAIVQGPDLPIYTMARYQLGWVDDAGRPVTASRGKALRPTLCLLMCEALGGDVDPAVPAAAGLELLHNFSLVHDDVMDHDRLRRHRPTVWAVWGAAQAINAGDLLNVLATLSVLRAPRQPHDAELAGHAVEALARGCARMTEGQHLDIAFETRDDVTIADYLEMIDGKSAALIGTSFEIGAIFAGNDALTRDRCRAYGHALGAVFQIRDDVLGVWGDATRTGKPVGSDIAKRKKSLPIVHALTHAADADRTRLRNFLADATQPPDVPAVTAILERAGSRDFAAAEMRRFLAAAEHDLAGLNVSRWGHAALADVAAFIARRDT